MSYPLENRELIAQAPGLRMQILTLAAGTALATDTGTTIVAPHAAAGHTRRRRGDGTRRTRQATTATGLRPGTRGAGHDRPRTRAIGRRGR